MSLIRVKKSLDDRGVGGADVLGVSHKGVHDRRETEREDQHLPIWQRLDVLARLQDIPETDKGLGPTQPSDHLALRKTEYCHI